MSPRNIDNLLDEIITLPSLPAALAQVIQVVDNPGSSLAELAKAVSSDPALAMKTLRIINSAYYGLSQKISSLDYAVVLLGGKVIKNLAFTATVFDSFRKGPECLLRHSIACGVFMRVLAEAPIKSPTVDPDDAFAYGLLHDVGKIILEEFLPTEMEEAYALCESRRQPLPLIERETIGADHAEIGACLARKWKLPEPLVGAIAAHHDLQRCPDPNIKIMAAAVSIADYACTACGMPSWPGPPVQIAEDTWAVLRLSSRDVPGLMEQFLDSLPAIDELIELAA